MHDSFRGYPAAWQGFMKGCPNTVMDAHIYQAWNRPGRITNYYDQACSFRSGVRAMEDAVEMPLIVGEWSLATDNCAMWLNGFNDNLPGFPKVVCQTVQCPAPYMGSEQAGAPPNETMPLQGPFGTGVSGPQFGKCPTGFEWGGSEDDFMTTLADKLQASYTSGHGWFFWNFRTEIEPRWSFLEAYARGWFRQDVSAFGTEQAKTACPNSDALAGPEDAPWLNPAAIVRAPTIVDRQTEEETAGEQAPVEKTGSVVGLGPVGIAAAGALATLVAALAVRQGAIQQCKSHRKGSPGLSEHLVAADEGAYEAYHAIGA